MNLKDKKMSEAVEKLRECDKMLKYLRNSQDPNKQEKILYYERLSDKQRNIIHNIESYFK